MKAPNNNARGILDGQQPASARPSVAQIISTYYAEFCSSDTHQVDAVIRPRPQSMLDLPTEQAVPTVLMHHEVEATNELVIPVYSAVEVQPQTERMIRFARENNNIADGSNVLTDEAFCALLGVEGASDDLVFIESDTRDRIHVLFYVSVFGYLGLVLGSLWLLIPLAYCKTYPCIP